MQPATSIEQLQTLSADIRAKRQGFITNFYLDAEKHGIWIAKGDCFVENVGNTLFIIKKSQTFWNVFYCSTTIEQLSADLKQLMGEYKGQTLVFDVVGREVQCQPVVDMFRQNGRKQQPLLCMCCRRNLSL